MDVELERLNCSADQTGPAGVSGTSGTWRFQQDISGTPRGVERDLTGRKGPLRMDRVKERG